MSKSRFGKLAPRVAICDLTTGVAWLYSGDDWKNKSIPGKKNECWQWKGAMHKQGYGLIYVKQVTEDFVAYYMTASRLAKAIELGRPLLKSERVIATCGNRSCTNPAHLKVGTHKDEYKFLRERTISKKT